MTKNESLEMYTDGEEFFIAGSAGQLQKMLIEFDIDSDREYLEEFVSMDKSILFTFNDEVKGKTTKTVGEWIKEFGVGFFASRNY